MHSFQVEIILLMLSCCENQQQEGWGCLPMVVSSCAAGVVSEGWSQPLSRDRCAAQTCLLCHGKFVQLSCTSPRTQELALAAEAALWSCCSLGAGRKLCAAPRSRLQIWKLLSSLIPSSVFSSLHSTWHQMFGPAIQHWEHK